MRNEGFNAISRALRVNSSLLDLNLYRKNSNCISLEHVACIVSFSDNCAEGDGSSIGMALKSNSSLTRLNLGCTVSLFF